MIPATADITTMRHTVTMKRNIILPSNLSTTTVHSVPWPGKARALHLRKRHPAPPDSPVTRYKVEKKYWLSMCIMQDTFEQSCGAGMVTQTEYHIKLDKVRSTQIIKCNCSRSSYTSPYINACLPGCPVCYQMSSVVHQCSVGQQRSRDSERRF